MEKLMYPAWKAEDCGADAFRDGLLAELAPALLTRGVYGLRVAVVDSDVEAAAPMRMAQLGAACDGLLSMWVDSAFERADIEALVADHCARYCGYSVLESAPLVPDETAGVRTPGMNQVVFLQRPPRLDRDSWFDTWLNDHTEVAVATQSTFSYRQNVVLRALTENAPAVDAIVEEGFPAAAMISQHAFYGVEDDAELERRRNLMMESCARFIDFDKLDLVPTSDYPVKLLVNG